MSAGIYLRVLPACVVGSFWGGELVVIPKAAAIHERRFLTFCGQRLLLVAELQN
jgi:hypothetical protein